MLVSVDFWPRKWEASAVQNDRLDWEDRKRQYGTRQKFTLHKEPWPVIAGIASDFFFNATPQ